MAAYQHNGRLLDVVANQQLQTWDIARKRRIAVIPTPNDKDHLDASGRVLISYPGGDAQSPQGLRLTRVADGHVLYDDTQAIFGPGNPGSLTLTADGMTAAYLTLSGVVRLVDLSSGAVRDLALLATLGPSQPRRANPRGRTVRIARGDADDIAVYRISDGQVLSSIPLLGDALAISPIGDQFAVNVDGRLFLWGIAR